MDKLGIKFKKYEFSSLLIQGCQCGGFLWLCNGPATLGMCHARYVSVSLLLQNQELGNIIHARADVEEALVWLLYFTFR
jgi:hypothetical protein